MRMIAFVALLSALLLPAMAGDKKGAKHPEGYAWEESYEMAKLKSAEQGKLLFIDFYTDS